MSEFDPTLDWLLGDGPDPGEDVRDAFLEVDVPPELTQQTLAAAKRLFNEADAVPMRSRLQLHRGGRVRSLVFGTGVVMALAAAVLLSVTPAPGPGNLDGMTQRGVGGNLPALDLRMAVRTEDGVDRLREDRSYGSGDVFYFRYEAAADGWLHLVHASATEIEVLDSLMVTRGNADLARNGEPLAWTVDDSDPEQAVFALVRTTLPVEARELESALSEILGSGMSGDPANLCEAATTLGLSCDAQSVRVQR
jgi:hypothetical protein